MPSMAEAGDLPSHGGADSFRGRTSPPSPRRFPAPAGSPCTASSAGFPRTPGRPDSSERRRPEDRLPDDCSPPFAGRSASMGPTRSSADRRSRRSQPLFCAARLNFPASRKCDFAATSRNPPSSGYPLFDQPEGRRESRRAQPSERFREESRMPARSGGRARPAAWLRSAAASADTPSVTGGGSRSPRNEGASGDPCEGADRNFSSGPANVEWEGLASPHGCDRSNAFPSPSRAAATRTGSRRIAKRAM